MYVYLALGRWRKNQSVYTRAPQLVFCWSVLADYCCAVGVLAVGIQSAGWRNAVRYVLPTTGSITVAWSASDLPAR